MRPYESLIIFDADLEEPAIAAVLDRATELVRSGGGERGPLDRWGKRTFAYEIRHRREGYYVVMEYTAVPRLPRRLTGCSTSQTRSSGTKRCACLTRSAAPSSLGPRGRWTG